MPGANELKVYLLNSLYNIPSLLVWCLVVVLVIGCVFLTLKKGWKKGFRAGAVILLVEFFFLILCTSVIFREAHVERGNNLVPFDSYFHYPVDSYFIEAAVVNFLNIIMFIPLGLLLGLAFKAITWKKVLLVGIVISVSIELLQFLFKKGFCEADDLIHNVLGCLIGYAIYRLIIKLIRYVQTLFQKTV